MTDEIRKAASTLKVRVSELTQPVDVIKEVKVKGVPTHVKVRKYAKLALPLEKAWHFLNGKKLIIGAVAVGCAFIPGVNPVIAEVLKYVGGAIAGVGGAHKAAKNQKTIGEKGEFGSGELVYCVKEFYRAAKNLWLALKPYFNKRSK